MKTQLVKNTNKYQMINFDFDIKKVTLTNGNIYETHKYTSGSGKTITYSFEISNKDALDVFNEIVGHEYALLVTINNDGTVNTQKVHPRRISKCFWGIQDPSFFISEIN